MISLQRLLGRAEEFVSLLEASAREGCNSVAALKRILTNPSATPTLDDFSAARRKDKEITNRLEEMLVTTFVTPMEREDIEELANALYKIPKTIEKFAERYILTAPQVRDMDFSRQMNLMEQAASVVLEMVATLRARDGLSGIKAMNVRLQKIEAEADNVMLDLIAHLYQPGFPTLKAIILRDLYELNEKVVDRCRDAGNVMSQIVLKNS